MSTLIAIPAAGLRAPSKMALSNRRLAWGLLVSLLLHGLLLSLQFGIPGLRPGAGRPLSVVLAPSTLPPVESAPAAVATPAPVAPSVSAMPPAPPVASAPAPHQATPLPTPNRPAPGHGFTLRDPVPALPAPPAPKPAPPARRTPRRRSRPRIHPPKESLHTAVIARQLSEAPSFVLPQPEIPALAEMTEAPAEHQDRAPAPQVAQQEDEEAAALARADAERELAQQRAAEEARRVVEQQLAEQRRAEELARQQLAEQQRAQQLVDQRRAEDLARQQLAEQRQAQQLAEQRRTEELVRQQLAEQQRAQQLAEQQRAQQLAEQQEAQQLAEQQRPQQLAERQQAQQLAEQRRAEELARQQLAEQQRAQQLAEQRRAEALARQQQAEQQQARQLAEQRQAEERAQQAAARQRAEELARQQAAEAEAAQRLARQDQASGQPAAEPGGSVVRADRGAGAGIDQGGGLGGGGGARGLPGRDFGSRARELLRGIDVAKAVPPVMRAAEQAQQAVRRAMADAARRDVPLRMYIDSVRQKIERNAVVSEAQLSSQAVHTDPVVSIAIRSDGSIDDVTILRSSGRPDIDEIVRRIVRLNARYAAFPPNVAANYDMIELRRIWTFAGVLRLVEEVR
jgi:hypothetical protein